MFYPLYHENMVLYCGKGHPFYNAAETEIDTEQLSGLKYAGFGFSSPNMTAGQKLGLQLAARVHNEEALMVLLLSGYYIGFLPDHVARPFVASGRLSAVMDEHTSYQTSLGAVLRKRPEPGRKTQLLLDCLLDSHQKK